MKVTKQLKKVEKSRLWLYKPYKSNFPSCWKLNSGVGKVTFRKLVPHATNFFKVAGNFLTFSNFHITFAGCWKLPDNFSTFSNFSWTFPGFWKLPGAGSFPRSEVHANLQTFWKVKKRLKLRKLYVSFKKLKTWCARDANLQKVWKVDKFKEN